MSNTIKQQTIQIYSWLFALLVSLLIRILLRFGSVLANVNWFDYLRNNSRGTVISTYGLTVEFFLMFGSGYDMMMTLTGLFSVQ